MKAYERVDAGFQLILNAALDDGDCSVPTRTALRPQEGHPMPHE